MRILIDHTTAHAFDTKQPSREAYHAVRALLQFVDELCFASEVWISDTESGRTWETTGDILSSLQERGLMTVSGQPLVRTYSVHDSEFEHRVLPRAARRLHETILRVELPGVPFDRVGVDETLAVREIRASVDSARDIPQTVLETEFGDSRWSRVQELISDKEKGPAAALFLLNEQLFAWARRLAARRPNADDPVYQHLHMLARVQINLELAAACSDFAEKEIHYAPSYARAAALATKYWPRSMSNLHLLQTQLWDTYLAYTGDAPQGATFPIPIVGAAILLALPPHSTLPNLLDAIGEVRGSDVGAALRDLVSERRSAIDIAVTINALAKKLKIPTTTAQSLKARTTIMTAAPFAKLELISEKDLGKYAGASPQNVLSYLYSKPDVVVLTAFLEELFTAEFPLGDIMERAQHILRLAV